MFPPDMTPPEIPPYPAERAAVETPAYCRCPIPTNGDVCGSCKLPRKRECPHGSDSPDSCPHRDCVDATTVARVPAEYVRLAMQSPANGWTVADIRALFVNPEFKEAIETMMAEQSKIVHDTDRKIKELQDTKSVADTAYGKLFKLYEALTGKERIPF